jgi:hypothetical protein
MWWASDYAKPLVDPAAPCDGGLLLVTGCRPWPPRPGPGRVCGACGGTVARRRGAAVCLWCHEASPGLRAAISKPSGRRHSEAGDVADAERRAKADLKARHKGKSPKLTERERRHLWAGVGYRNAADFNVRVTAARAWLREIGQTPDWSLVIDRRGNEIGRRECETADPADPADPAPVPLSA